MVPLNPLRFSWAKATVTEDNTKPSSRTANLRLRVGSRLKKPSRDFASIGVERGIEILITSSRKSGPTR